MKTRFLVLLLGIPMLTARAQYTFQGGSVSAAGGMAQLGFFSLTASVAQPTPPGSSSGGPYTLGSGFVTGGQADALAPSIQTTPIATTPASQQVTVRAQITDNVTVTNALMYYRKGGDPIFMSLTMSLVGGAYQSVIPAIDVTTVGLEYYLTATDAAGNRGRMPVSGVYVIRVVVGGEGITRTSAQPGGGEQTAYRLFSVPMDVDNKSPQAVLEDDLGPYDKTKWRFFELKSDQTYVEYPNTSPMTPGKAFWLIVKDAGKVIDTGPGTTDATNTPFSIALNPGWTFVSNPFNFSIPKSKITVNGQPLNKLTFFTGNGYDSVSATSMTSFEGYLVSSGVATDLLINPDLSSGSLQKENAGSVETNALWFIRIKAQCEAARDVDNVASVLADAKENEDANDEPEPPVIGEYVSVSFPHPEWNSVFKKFCTDARPAPHDGALWKYEINSNIKNLMHLAFEGLATVPHEFGVWMVDDLLKTTRNLRSESTYDYQHNAVARGMTLVVGSETYVQQQLKSLGTVPTSFELSQNFPNPFNPSTIIRYGLPVSSYVTLKVYNILGQEVATLVKGELQPSGYRSFEFDAKNFGSGVYFYVLQAGEYTAAKKCMLIK